MDRSIFDLDRDLEEGKLTALELPAGVDRFQFDLSIEPGPMAMISYGLQEGRSAYTMPIYSSAFSDIPGRHYLTLIRRSTRTTTPPPNRFEQEHYLLLLALSHSDMNSHFVGVSSGVELQVSAEKSSRPRVAALLFRGNELHAALQTLLQGALVAAGDIGRLRINKPPLPPWLDRIGWESGLAFGPEVSHDAILETIADFHQKGIHFSYLLIDEGWQELADHPTANCLASFRADPSRFPGGLLETTRKLTRFGIHNVGVWHGLMGARGGVHSKLAKQYGLPVDETGRYYLGEELGPTFQFYFDYYEALKKEGITFVKVGDQGRARLCLDRGAESTLLYKNLQIAIQAAGSIHFNYPHLNADCLRNENLFYWSTSRIARAGRNLHPNSRYEVYRALRDHLSNSFWLHHLMQPDFDTWSSSSPYFETTAIFHALATSMNAISDRAGEQRRGVLQKLILPSGRILKTNSPLILTEESLFHNPLQEKVVYTASTRVANCGVVGAFNLLQEEEPLQGSLSPQNIVGLEGELFAVYSYRSGFLGRMRREERINITVKPRLPDIYTFAPIEKGVAVIGCHLFFLPRATLTEIQIEEEAVYLSSLVAGPTLLFCPRELLEVRRNGDVVAWDQDPETGLLCIDTRNQPIEMECHYTLLFAS